MVLTLESAVIVKEVPGLLDRLGENMTSIVWQDLGVDGIVN